jgi:hypothetical protein
MRRRRYLSKVRRQPVGGSDRRSRVDDRIWKNLSIALGIACAVLLGIAGALMVVHKGSPSASTGPDSSISEGSQVPTDSAGNPASPGPSSSQGPTGTPGPTA